MGAAFCHGRDDMLTKTSPEALAREAERLKKMTPTQLRALHSARHKFQQLDANDSGTLDAKEMNALADWALAALGTEKTKVTDEQRVVFLATLKATVQEKKTKALEFDEFAVWYGNVCKEIANKKRSNLLSSKVQAQNDAMKKLSPAQLKTLERARHKFDQLDLDDSGFLEFSEMEALADWAILALCPGKKKATQKERKQFAVTLKASLDANKDKKIDFDEFQAWYASTCEKVASAQKVAHARQKALHQAEVKAVQAMQAEEKRMLEQCQKKFDEFDVNADHFLKGDELLALVEWVIAKIPFLDTDKKEAADKILADFDTNKDQAMDFAEFTVWFKETNAALDAYANSAQ